MTVTGGPSGGYSGPFETSDEVLALPAVRAVYEGFRVRPGQGLMCPLTLEKILQPACRAAGLTLGEHDRRILKWLAGFGPEEAAVIAALITRAAKPGGSA
ncbi:MAG: hypothetical protein JWM19_5827 [Actinomycetia bacterium]|nr:hypothetical protein [Actinomycetes bacterium]